jgi:hypothetical protein
MDPDDDVQPDIQSVQMRQELRRRVRAEHLDPRDGQPQSASGGRHSRRDLEQRSAEQRTEAPRPRLDYVPRHAVSTPGPSAVSADALTEQFQMDIDQAGPTMRAGVESSGPQPQQSGPQPAVPRVPTGRPGSNPRTTGATVWARNMPPVPTVPPATGLVGPGVSGPGGSGPRRPVDGPGGSGPGLAARGRGAAVEGPRIADPTANEVTGSIERITDDAGPATQPNTSAQASIVTSSASVKEASAKDEAAAALTAAGAAVTASAVSGTGATQTSAASSGASKGSSAVESSGPIESSGRTEDLPPGKRVRVVLSQRKGGNPRPVRTVVDIQELTQVGELLSASLIRSQLALALRIGGVITIALGSLPAIFVIFPVLGRVEFFGVRLPWLLLGVLSYPFMLALGYMHARSAERLEQVFADHIQS